MKQALRAFRRLKAACIKGFRARSADTAPAQSAEQDNGTANHPISQTQAKEIALVECKVNYDYIKTAFDATQNAWEIGFWEDNAVIASQTIVVNGAGNILNSWFAE